MPGKLKKVGLGGEVIYIYILHMLPASAAECSGAASCLKAVEKALNADRGPLEELVEAQQADKLWAQMDVCHKGMC